ncbi:ABC transporter ATP-binding protein [Clostridium celatum]|uniref:Putative mutacin ABC transporter, ATP-binding protein MutF n=1 Tax=Clostridium celatum DSM 1785 TaxID=545697 RepID=L1QFF1_9CLOT|nr:ABC transporter ATP-binding protein [Clostridium celatum]EKY26681.1 putative mutacin ABC transporter, ATP-binding protein MutF [Clostridium celatum DSM 1785]MCE9653776.1 ABC transporter ATP-binding protein [Clostridium celatum]MDU3721701.1 ABC transporter ATP-binding protein [Clostridium celatum]MDU6296155.1 ABC transporter ATP-binding protein [Clostridium celatum]MDY3360576.1 ABC transporter ATP-binding protein [Clostridium celatum]
MSKVILDVNNLSKKFKNFTAVDNISFQLHSGEILGFLGPNGAGKTTTIKMITGLVKSNSGSITINGYDINKDFEDAMSNVGAIVETPHLYENMTGYENIKFFSNLCKNATKEHIEECIKLSGLKNRLNDKVKNYSLGMKQRLGLTIALLNNPKLLILDEPTNGLDPIGIKVLREFLKDLAHNKNLSILVSSHILTEMELLCDKVLIITNGKMRCIKSMEEINKTSSLEEVFIQVAGEDNVI